MLRESRLPGETTHHGGEVTFSNQLVDVCLVWNSNGAYHESMQITGKPTRWQRLIGNLNEFLFGAAMSWVMPPYQLRRRAELERVFILLTTCELMGVPSFTRRFLLPFAVTRCSTGGVV
jgi:hypothetical protein